MIKKKILQISCEGLGNGGVQAVIMGICTRLSNDFIFDILLFTNEVRYYDETFLNLGGNIYRFSKNDSCVSKIFSRLYFLIKLPFVTYSLLKNHGPYIAIHCHNCFEGGLCCLGAYFAGVPIRICHSHSIANTDRNWKDKLYSFILKPFVNIFSNVKIGCSKAAVQYLFGDNSKSIVIYNGIDMNKFSLSKYPNVIKKPFSFIHIGQYSHIKNQSFLLDVFKIIHDCIPEATLDLMGFGQDEAMIRNKVAKLGLNNSVTMHRHDEDRVHLLAKSKYMIFPSLFEGFGIVLIEAQAMGVYCFASDSIPLETDAGLIEYLCLSDGAKNWADHILNFIKRDKNIKMPDECKLLKYDFLAIVEKYRHIYQG